VDQRVLHTFRALPAIYVDLVVVSRAQARQLLGPRHGIGILNLPVSGQ